MTAKPFVPTRRMVLKAGAALSAMTLGAPMVAAGDEPRCTVIGGGFGGVIAARTLNRLGVSVTLVEPNETYVACPMSNHVLAGLRSIAQQTFRYDALEAEGIRIVRQSAARIDAEKRTVQLNDGTTIEHDRAIVAPGIAFNFNALPGYDAEAVTRMPHAWKAGEQTLLLAKQIREMQQGGTVVVSVPANPYRCPPGPYERVSLIAAFLKANNPHAKIILLDAKDQFSKQALFLAAWEKHYPGMIDYVPLSKGGKVIAVNPEDMTLTTEFEEVKGDVVNVIPPQTANTFALENGLADRSQWCPIDPLTWESKLVPGVHVIGDAALMGAVPKSGFAAHAQGKSCGYAVASLLHDRPVTSPKLINTCYSFVTADQAISVAGVYQPQGSLFADVPGAGGTSPLNAPSEQYALEARYAAHWFDTTTRELFG